ncbi:MAG TPA: hypothetical protein VKE70_04310 [Candidatus Solibacter sp.]|nr:hypothetical protein [Candidatus Solibacter sp.]
MVRFRFRAKGTKRRIDLADVLFGGSRILFWTLAPLLILITILLGFYPANRSAQATVIALGVDSLVVLLILAMYDPKRFHWAGRAAMGLVFLVFLAYLIYEIDSGQPLRLVPRSEPGPVNALLGLLLIGVPCLRYTLIGRFGRKPKAERDDHEFARSPRPIE